MPNKETGESIVVSVMKETNFHVSAISNFYMVHEGAEKVIMLKRFEKLASLWVPDRMRQSKLMELWDEDPLFREKLFGLFDKNRKGGYINAKSRTKYIALNVGGISGEELLWVLEEDYNHVIR